MNIYLMEMKLTVYTADYVINMDSFFRLGSPYSVLQVIADGVENLFRLIRIAKYWVG